MVTLPNKEIDYPSFGVFSLAFLVSRKQMDKKHLSIS